MLTKIQRWGNSQGIRIAKNLLEDARLDVGDEVDIKVKHGALIVKPIKRGRGRYRLEDLVSKISDSSRTEEIDWGKPEGKEVW